MDSPKLNIGEFSLNTFHTGTALHTASVNGDKIAIERLLKQRDAGNIQTLNKGDRYGRAALVYTVFGEWYECAEILVRHGASVLQVDCDKRSVLHWAAYLARPKFIKLFLEHVGLNLEWNLGDKDGRTPLHFAAMQPNSKCLRLLLKHLPLDKRSLNATDNEQMTALHWSVFYNRLENFKLLAREQADMTKRDAKGRCLLHMAVLNPSADSVGIARLLLKLNKHYSRHLDTENRTALHLAVANGNEELVRELCMAEKSALNNVDELSRSALHYAVLKNNLNIIDILISAGASPYRVDNTGASVLHYAAKNNNVHIVSRFLVCFQNFEDFTDEHGRTALMWAASEGSVDVLNFMLRNLSYFNIHASDEQGLTALHFACIAGHENCVRLLVANSADISQPDKLGQTPLFKACQQGHGKIIDILMHTTGHQGTMGDFNGHTETHRDHERLQVGNRQGVSMDNANPMGKHLFAIQEEPTNSLDTLKNSKWTHELTESSSEAFEKPTTGPFSDICTSEVQRPEIHHQGHTLRDIDNHGEYSGGCTTEGPKSGRDNSPRVLSSEMARLSICKLHDDNGCTPLHYAAHAGHTPVCSWLLSNGVDPRKRDEQGRTALHGAAFNGHTECMALMLLDHPGLENDRDKEGYSVLHHAAINGQLEAVKLLVCEPYFAFPNYRVKSTDWTPLDFAMAADNQDVTQFLMDNGALTIAWLQDLAADTIKRFLRRLAKQRREAKVKPLIERHKQLTKEESLKYREKHTQETEENNRRETVTSEDDTVDSDLNSENLRLTAANDQLRTSTTSENETNSGSVYHDMGDNDQLRTSTKSDDTTHFDLTSEDHRYTTDNDELEPFTNLFGEIQVCDSSNEIFFLDACYHGNLELVLKLAHEKIDVNCRDENGCTALHFAAAQDHDMICEVLLQLGTETYKRDINGRTALHNASIAGKCKSISLLLSHNKELIMYLDCDNRSALHYAASMGHIEAVKLLLSEHSGIQDLRAKSTSLTALDCAILAQHDDVMEFMISQGVKPSGQLAHAARVIQRNFRKWLRRKTTYDDKHSENTEYRLVEKESSLENCQERSDNSEYNEAHDFVHEISSDVQTKSSSSTFETDQNSRPSHSNLITKESEEFSEVFTPNPESDYGNSRKEGKNTLTSSEHFSDSRSETPDNRAQNGVSLGPGLTFAQSNIANLSRAPENVVLVSGKKEMILRLRNNWERIALLRRKKHAAVVIQRCFRKHLEATRSRQTVADKNAAKESRNMVENGDDKFDGSSSAQNVANVSSTGLKKNQIKLRIPDKILTTDETIKNDKMKMENVLKVDKKESSPSVCSQASIPKRLTRKSVVNRLRTASPEHSSSENEPSRNRRYKSTFPLLSPKSSSTSSNGRSPSNVSANQLPNKHANQSRSNKRVDVAPTLTKNELVSQWLSDSLITGNPSQGDWNTKNTNKSQNTVQQKTSVQQISTTKPRSASKTDTSKPGARRGSSQSARVRRDSLIKNAYGSPAAHSYNFALDTYHPLASRRGRKDTAFPFRTSSRVRPNSMKRVEGGWIQNAAYTLGSTPSESCNNTC